MTNLESKFQASLIKELKKTFEGCLVIKTPTDYIQGLPDLLLLFGKQWAMLECKASEKATRQPNQAHYIKLLGDMSFAAIIHPDNKDQVLHDLQRAFRSDRAPRIPERK
jgi:hypothetical protein